MLELLNVTFHLFHFVIILINLFGWVLKKTLRVTVFVQLLTLLSWFALGPFYGYGYCFLTDWHWQIRFKMGIFNDPHSYTKFLADKMLNEDINSILVDRLTFILFFIACFCSVIRIIYEKRKKLN